MIKLGIDFQSGGDFVIKKSWLEELIEVALEESEKARKKPGYFDLSNVSNIPYVEFDNLTEEQCKEIQKQAKQVMYKSKFEYDYNEVAIVYNMNNVHANDCEYFVSSGTKSEVAILSNERINDFTKQKNPQNELVVIILHNHSDNSLFSINDVMIFLVNPSVKILSVVNKKGEIAFLSKSKIANYQKFVVSIIIEESIPDLRNRYNKRILEIRDTNDSLKFEDVATFDERKTIIKKLYDFCDEMGIVHTPFLSKNSTCKTSNENVENKLVGTKRNENSINESSFTSENNVKFGSLNEAELYEENGEDKEKEGVLFVNSSEKSKNYTYIDNTCEGLSDGELIMKIVDSLC